MLNKLLLYIIVGLAGFTALLSGTFMLLSGNYSQTVLLISIILIGSILAFYGSFKTFSLNKEWKKKQVTEISPIIATWRILGKEWDAYKMQYASTKKIKRDAIIYGLFSVAFFIPVILLIFTTISGFKNSIVITSLSAPIFFLLISYWIYTVTINRKLPFIKANEGVITGGQGTILFNDSPIFLNTPGLSLIEIRTEKWNEINSAVFIIDFRAGIKRITQEHRIPVSADSIETATHYLKKLSTRYRCTFNEIQ